MSVINRMLSDLERRGAPGARALHAPGGPATARRSGRARRWLTRAAPLLVLAALVAVAAGLWRERAPDILTLMTSAPLDSAPADASADASAPAQAALAGAPAVAVGPDALSAAEGEDSAKITEQEQPTDAHEHVDPADAPTGEDPGPGGDNPGGGDRAPAAGEEPAQAAQMVRAEADAKPSAPTPDRAPDSTSGRVAQAEPKAEAKSESRIEEETRSASQAAGHQAEAGATAQSETGRRRITLAGRTDDRPAAEGAEDSARGRVTKSSPERTPAQRAREREQEARRALADGDSTRARRLLRQTLALDASRHEARDLLVTLALRAGEQETARNLLAKGLKQARGRPGFAKPYARLLVDAGALEKALAVLQPANEAAADDAGYHGLVAAIAQRLGRNGLAARQYTRALQLNDRRGIWWLGLGISLAAEDHAREARAAFEKASASGDLNERLQQWVERRIADLS